MKELLQSELQFNSDSAAHIQQVSPTCPKPIVSRCNLWNGDCLELMSQIPAASIDMIFADLPYGTTACDWDIKIPLDALWHHWNRIIKDSAAVILTGQQPFTTDIINSNRKHFRYEIIWEKTMKLGFFNANKMPLRGHENIIVFYKKLPTYNPQKTYNPSQATGRVREKKAARYKAYSPTNAQDYVETGWKYPHSVIRISNWNGALFGNNSKATKHPTQKPVELLDWLIKTYTNEGDTVLDCVMGSGTTGVSCKKNNRHFIGIEKEKSFYDVAVSRVSSCSG
ncbi:MAG: site-specific DNA-methyltransferase [Chitinophagaceae bacterium]|nr:MAG: site-specific DNA-methyltransferase [Chitinophagaceae bacterium]